MAKRTSRPAARASAGVSAHATVTTPAPLAPGAPCPCGLPAAYGECCGALHAGRSAAPTAERLMRSRYSAFAVRDAAYLLRTWAPGTRPPAVDFDPRLRWTGLDILATTDGTAFHTQGTVSFAAHYEIGGERGVQREDSRFVRVQGSWLYVDAIS
ncbi:YchJ family protein [Actinacidiphila guanduensis]|uniref:UPF0225 protein SAMN05216259_101437 n=1 Tax=Actinacidiphila guanduensis TaxID=310781 RepID=A0A1G9VXZ6_9ACTN|nr:YchJ family metal-binding protein [Actinacidiphila guanduensis]SDM76786.1 SEC-C motif-containing protein [Actinacidiphila guanduensis]